MKDTERIYDPETGEWIGLILRHEMPRAEFEAQYPSKPLDPDEPVMSEAIP